MSNRLNHERLNKRKKPSEEAFPKEQKVKGGWTHIKQNPVRILTTEQVAAIIEGRPDRETLTNAVEASPVGMRVKAREKWLIDQAAFFAAHEKMEGGL